MVGVDFVDAVLGILKEKWVGLSVQSIFVICQIANFHLVFLLNSSEICIIVHNYCEYSVKGGVAGG